jgi:hypothetical protein
MTPGCEQNHSAQVAALDRIKLNRHAGRDFMTLKKDPILVALGECPEKWNQYLLKTYGLPHEPQSRNEVSESAFVDEEGSRSSLEALAARQIRPGEEPPKGLLKVWAENSRPENEPSEQWKRSQAFMRMMTRIVAWTNKLDKLELAQLLKDVDDLQPDNPLPVFDECLGSPEEFLERWRCHELDVRFVYKRRGVQVFEIRRESIPPDE